MRATGLLLSSLALAACGGDVGTDGSEIPIPYDSLRGGFVFATRAILGSNGYDLYAAAIPNVADGRNTTPVRLTDTAGNETQPSVAGSGSGIAYAGADGIYVITSPEGRIARITDTSETDFVDSLPAVSYNADRVAWVRADTSRPIGETGFVETYIMMANFDGTDVVEVAPSPGIIQDAPAFDPRPDPAATRLAWSEFLASSVAPGLGPTIYGVQVYDFKANSGFYPCRSQDGLTPRLENVMRVDAADNPRCFAQHLVWPEPETIVLGQSMLNIYLDGRLSDSPLAAAHRAYSTQQDGFAIRTVFNPGFYPAWPLSVSYSLRDSVMIFDGVYLPVDGMNNNSLGIWVAGLDGGNVTRLLIASHINDIDTINTGNYLFSVATPRIVPR